MSEEEPIPTAEPEESGTEPLWAGAYRPRRTPLVEAVGDILARMPNMGEADLEFLEKLSTFLSKVWELAFPDLPTEVLVRGPESQEEIHALISRASESGKGKDRRTRVALLPEERLAMVELARHARAFADYSPGVDFWSLKILAASLKAGPSDLERLRKLAELHPDL
ncbi:MAG: hypothetical protein WHU10_00290 [Fimbriimonadales bacterium]